MGWGVGVRRQVIDDSSATDQGRHDSIDRSMEWNPTDCTARVVMHGQPSLSTQHSSHCIGWLARLQASSVAARGERARRRGWRIIPPKKQQPAPNPISTCLANQPTDPTSP